jgi:hypothetical protein
MVSSCGGLLDQAVRVVPAFVAFPIWLLLLSNRLRRHVSEREASTPELAPVV